EKACGQVTENKHRLYRAVVSLCSFRAKQQFSAAAEKCAAFLGPHSESILSLTYEARDFLAAKRLIADATSQEGKYIF
ncbi:MAG TPA: hypothetical protein DDY32_11835, partial [Desulfobulbaceae bacterium]|nr:hypothetical protein [Desulfobulbaceae bacterium]